MHVFGWKENRSPTNVLYMIPSEVKPFLHMCKHGPVPAKSFKGTLQTPSLSRYAVFFCSYIIVQKKQYKKTRSRLESWEGESVDQQPQ